MTTNQAQHGSDGPRPDALDRATADRLGRLRTMPVDTTSLDRLLGAELPLPSARAVAVDAPPAPSRLRSFWRRPVRTIAAAAASVAVVATLAVALLLTTAARPVQASAPLMVQMHRDLVAGRVPVVQVDSIDAAGRALTAQWPQAPDLPDVPAEHVMACCMKSVKDKRVACVLLRTGDTPDAAPVTLVVGDADDVRGTRSGERVITRDGVRYHVESADAVTMVSAERNGRWVCLMGELPAERLVDLAAQMRF